MMKKMRKHNVMAILFTLAVGMTASGVAVGNLSSAKADGAQAIVMEEGAGVKIVNSIADSGMRFTMNVPTKVEEGATVKYGMVIAPAVYVDGSHGFTVENLFENGACYYWDDNKIDGKGTLTGENAVNKHVGNTLAANNAEIWHVTPTVLEQNETSVTLAGAIVNFAQSEKDLLREYVCRGYAAITTESGTTYQMAEYFGGDQANNTRSMSYVAQKGIENGKDNAEGFLLNTYVKPVENTQVSYTVYHHLPDVAEPVVEVLQAKLGETVQATLKAGYDLDAEKSNVSGTVYANGKLSLHCYYNVKTYAVTYHNVEASNHSNPVSYQTSAEAIALTDADNGKDIFLGWYTADDVAITEIPANAAEDYDIYAKWELADYKLVSASGWNADTKTFRTLDFGVENAGKTVALVMQMKGSLTAGTSGVGFRFSASDGATFDGEPYCTLSTTFFTNDWKPLAVETKLDSTGKIVIRASLTRNDTTCNGMVMYLKGVEVVTDYEAIATVRSDTGGNGVGAADAKHRQGQVAKIATVDKKIYAGETLIFKANVITSADGSDFAGKDFFVRSCTATCNKSSETYENTEVSFKIGETVAWREVTIKGYVQEDGNVYVLPANATNAQMYGQSILLKDVTMVDVELESIGTAKHAGGGSFNSGTVCKVYLGTEYKNQVVTVNAKVKNSEDGTANAGKQILLISTKGYSPSYLGATQRYDEVTWYTVSDTMAWRVVQLQVHVHTDGYAYIGAFYDYGTYPDSIQATTTTFAEVSIAQ